MKLFRWLSGRFSTRAKALLLYRRGMIRAKRRDHRGALKDYTSTIDLANVPHDVKAMALYNRALVHVAAGNSASGISDLNAVLAMEHSPLNVRTMTRQKLLRMETRSDGRRG